MTTTSPRNLIVVKLLFALIVLGLAVAAIAFLYWLEYRQERRVAQAKKAVREIQHNPDAAWLYSQGLTPEQIEAAVRTRVNIL